MLEQTNKHNVRFEIVLNLIFTFAGKGKVGLFADHFQSR